MMMAEYFGFDPASLSDEELLTRQTQLQGRLVWASRFGSMELMSSLQHMVEMIEFERMDRMQRNLFNDRMAIAPSIIESDPSLKQEKKEEPRSLERPQRVQEKRSQPSAPRIAITRTARPTNNQADQ